MYIYLTDGETDRQRTDDDDDGGQRMGHDGRDRQRTEDDGTDRQMTDLTVSIASGNCLCVSGNAPPWSIYFLSSF